MRIISCASYHGTGSSAITDFFTEFDNCYSLTKYEFRFVQDPNGISDLEFNLVENHHRLNSGRALKMYKKFVDFASGNNFMKKYEPFFQYRWKEISYDYIKKLTQFTYPGYWHQDVIDKGKNFYIRKRLTNKILQKTIWRGIEDKNLNEMPNEISYATIRDSELFLKHTREYIDKLFKIANKDNKDNIMVDQIVPPTNLDRYIRYFNDIKVFVVDRDPRDLYMLSKYVWKGKVIPTEDLDIFCKWYLYTREHRKKEKYNSEKVMLIQFEDLIYKYNETTSKMIEWLGMDVGNHVRPFSKFNPEISIKNTRVWERIPGHEREIEYIETQLKEYLYNYEEVLANENSNGI